VSGSRAGGGARTSWRSVRPIQCWGHSELLRRALRGSGVGLSVVPPGGVRTAIARRARPGSLTTRPLAELERGHADFERRLVTSPHRAAARILRGIEGDEGCILIGPDATVIDVVQRLFPTRCMAALEPLI
jgi:short-subunit dehydrogenase